MGVDWKGHKMTEKHPKHGAKNLKLFQLAYQLSLEIHRESMGWDKREQFNGVAGQLQRSSKSICANLVEGYAKKSTKKDTLHFIHVARGSLAETILWCDYAKDLNLASEALSDDWALRYEEVSGLLSGFREWIIKQ